MQPTRNVSVRLLTWRASQYLSLDVKEYFHPVELMVMNEIKLIVVCEFYTIQLMFIKRFTTLDFLSHACATKKLVTRLRYCEVVDNGVSVRYK